MVSWPFGLTCPSKTAWLPSSGALNLLAQHLLTIYAGLLLEALLLVHYQCSSLLMLGTHSQTELICLYAASPACCVLHSLAHLSGCLQRCTAGRHCLRWKRIRVPDGQEFPSYVGNPAGRASSQC